jgi:hypothetical protein
VTPGLPNKYVLSPSYSGKLAPIKRTTNPINRKGVCRASVSHPKELNYNSVKHNFDAFLTDLRKDGQARQKDMVDILSESKRQQERQGKIVNDIANLMQMHKAREQFKKRIHFLTHEKKGENQMT